MTEGTQKTNKKLKRRILNIFILFCFVAAAYFFYQSIMTKVDEKNSNEIYSEIAKLYEDGLATTITPNQEPLESNNPVNTETPSTEEPAPTEPPATEGPTPAPTVQTTQQPEPHDSIPQREILDRTDIIPYFNDLLDVNEDIRGYIKMPESTILYPVVQGIDNKFYLERDIYGKKTISASIFMDYRNNVKVLDDNTIIYGHNLNTTMFNDLDFFVDEETREEFYAANGIFRFDTVYKYMQWEVFSAYVVDKDDFNYLITNFQSDQAHQAFIDETLERSAVDWGIEITIEDNILTLSTCNHWYNDSRTVVHARLITP